MQMGPVNTGMLKFIQDELSGLHLRLWDTHGIDLHTSSRPESIHELEDRITTVLYSIDKPAIRRMYTNFLERNETCISTMVSFRTTIMTGGKDTLTVDNTLLKWKLINSYMYHYFLTQTFHHRWTKSPIIRVSNRCHGWKDIRLKISIPENPH